MPTTVTQSRPSVPRFGEGWAGGMTNGAGKRLVSLLLTVQTSVIMCPLHSIKKLYGKREKEPPSLFGLPQISSVSWANPALYV